MITLSNYTGGQHVFIEESNGYPGIAYSGGGIDTTATAIRIKWSGTTNNVTIQYSINGGSTWTNIDTGVSGSAGQYDWTPDVTEREALFGGSGYPNDTCATVRFKLIDETTADNSSSSTNFEISKVSINSLVPNSDNGQKIHKDSHVWIWWGYKYTFDIQHVKIEYSTNGGSSWSNVIASTDNYGFYGFIPNDLGLSTESVILRISSADSGHQTDCYTSTAFDLTDDTDDILNTSQREYDEDFSDVFLLGLRIMIEKGIFPNEAVALSQFEAGTGIEILQRNHQGKILVGDAVALEKAFNLVIKSKNAVASGRPRAKQGTINFLANGVHAGGTPYGGDYYGIATYIDITHDWHLGDSVNDINYVSGKTQNSFVFQAHEIVSLDNRTRTEYDTEVRYEALTKDVIRVYCTIKGTSEWTQTGSTITPDSLVTLDKDKIGYEVGTFLFEYRIEEVIPTA